MTVEGLLAKAEQAAASALVLLEIGDADGACNRAYFAMFDAARAALMAAATPEAALAAIRAVFSGAGEKAQAA